MNIAALGRPVETFVVSDLVSGSMYLIKKINNQISIKFQKLNHNSKKNQSQCGDDWFKLVFGILSLLNRNYTNLYFL